MSDNTEETLGTLDGQVDVEKVYTQDETRLYRCRTILGYLEDDYQYDFSEAKLEFFESPVRVFSDQWEPIGFADVFIQGGKLVADIAIDYSTPERLAAETHDGVRHYARFRSQLAVTHQSNPRRGRFSDLAPQPSKTKIFGIVVIDIVLSTDKPDDDRIQPFGELVI